MSDDTLRAALDEIAEGTEPDRIGRYESLRDWVHKTALAALAASATDRYAKDHPHRRDELDALAASATGTPEQTHSAEYNRGWADGNASALDACNPVIEQLQARLAASATDEGPQPFVVRQFEGSPWVPLHEAARLHDAVEEAGVTIAGLRNALREAEATQEAMLAATQEASRDAALAASATDEGPQTDEEWLMHGARPARAASATDEAP